MNILFLDPNPRHYTADTPLLEPLGGTQSAVAYLSTQLARAGAKVAVANGVGSESLNGGVRFVPYAELTATFINRFDAAIVVGAALGKHWRRQGVTVPLLLWCHHAADQPDVQVLRQEEERASWSGYAMLTQWQAQGYLEAFSLPKEDIHLIGNAVSPAVLSLAERDPWFLRGRPPVLAYISTPFRGLDVLLTAFPSIRKSVPGATLRVYSGMSLYGIGAADDPYAALYELSRALPGCDYLGALPQPDLAAALASADVFAYPCIFAETSCISAMEAMAAGLMLVTTNYGALGETTAGFARLLELDAPHRIGLAASFARFLADSVHAAAREPKVTAQRLAEQRRFARQNYAWERRAGQWLQWLTERFGIHL